MKEKQLLETLIDNLDEGIQIVDESGITVYYNHKMSNMEGLKKDQVLGKRFNQFINDINDDKSTFVKAMKSKEIVSDIVQQYSSYFGKHITTINTTIPIFDDDKLSGAIEISKDLTTLKELNEKLCKIQRDVGNTPNYVFNDIIGSSKSIIKIIEKGKMASLTNSSVLIYGETGCGKELFAQSIHYSGLRSGKPFIPINCAAIPASLLEGILFGTTKGSFTGAENKKGIFEEADGGTLLLDEVNSLDPVLQSKLLRVLQEGYIRPVGSNKTIDIDVRIIATINEEPEKLIREGKLRKDFYYRLSVIRLNIPPLRERKEDIKDLIMYFIKYYNQLLGKNVQDVSLQVYESFMKYDWPGNIRELKNNIENAMNMAEGTDILNISYFEGRIFENTDYEIKVPAFDNTKYSLPDYLEKVENIYIKNCLSRNNNNISKAAKELKISRQALQYKINKRKMT
jgi:arginine utilization regulatory protein